MILGRTADYREWLSWQLEDMLARSADPSKRKGQPKYLGLEHLVPMSPTDLCYFPPGEEFCFACGARRSRMHEEMIEDIIASRHAELEEL